MTTHSKLLTLATLIFLLSCKNPVSNETPKQPNISECQPYFAFDEVEHYRININAEEVWDIEKKETKTDNEKRQLELLIRYAPEKLSDTTILTDIDKIGFVKHDVPESKFEQLNEIFCERTHPDGPALACIAIYRDILIFRKKGEIVGTAKICFGCEQHVITGTTKETRDFGQSGDYEKLDKLLK